MPPLPLERGVFYIYDTIFGDDLQDVFPCRPGRAGKMWMPLFSPALSRFSTPKSGGALRQAEAVQEFANYEAVSGWALEAMTWAVNAGVLNGRGDGVLDPAGHATRAEAAQILMNFRENAAK